MKNPLPYEKIIDFTEDDCTDMEIPPADHFSNKIIKGCLVASGMAAVVVVCAILYYLSH